MKAKPKHLQHAQENGFDESKLKDKELVKVSKKVINKTLDALDIALFGRMVAKAPDMNVEAAASFAHAISTHKVSNEIEFFTAVDDCKTEEKKVALHIWAVWNITLPHITDMSALT